MKEIADVVKAAGATLLEGVPTDDYSFSNSEAVENGKLLGLALDDINESDKTETRIDTWLEAIKPFL